MSNRNRFEYAALGLVVGVGLSLIFLVWAVPEFHHASNHQSTYNAQQHASGDQADKEGGEHYWVSSLSGWVYTEDSLAQWFMAALGIAATAISVLALIWLKRTWDETRRSADAAWATIDATKRIGEAQVRAYLTCTEGAYAIEKGWAQAWLTIINKGQSPAFDVKVKAAWSVMLPKKDDPTGWDRVDGKPSENETEIIAASSTARIFLLWTHTDIGTEALDHIRAGSPGFNIDGKLSWTDVFKKEHSILFTVHEHPGGSPFILWDKFDREGKLEAYNRSASRHVGEN